MGGGDLLSILIQTVKSKMTGLVTKFRLYTNWNFIKTKIFTKIRDFFSNLLGVKPRNKYDYFTIGRWMFSKRLLYALVIIIGVLSIWYISTETTLFRNFSEDGIVTYKYNSLRLRTAKGHVKIKGKSGYVAYDGDVSAGYVNGNGTLFNKYGAVVYTGTFTQNKYEGIGTLNYESGNVMYKGSFHENLYEGEGTLYREDGTREYVGEFSKGKKNGEGILYDTGENELYEGVFASDSIVYSEMLGKTVADLAQSYKGHRDLYTTSYDSVGVMNEIDALYHARIDSDALDDSETIDSVYVLTDTFKYGNESINTIDGLEEVLGKPVYEGNSMVLLPEAISINELSKTKTVMNGPVEMELDQTFSDVAEVKSIDYSYVVYIYTYRKGDVMYSFVGNGRDNTFDFYYVSGVKTS